MPKPILVVGDACVDIFVYGHCHRLCPEAPVPVLDATFSESNLGMAGNVYRNILALEYPAVLLCNADYEQVTKTRYVDIKTNHMFLRIDGKASFPHIQNIQTLPFDDYAAIVISDYNKGSLSFEDIEYISTHHPLTFLDTKRSLGAWAKNITYIKINRVEFRENKSFVQSALADKTIETLGDEGCSFQGKVYPVESVEVKNLSGAGDSFLAGLVVKYLETNGDMGAALVFANRVATIVVQKRGVSPVTNMNKN